MPRSASRLSTRAPLRYALVTIIIVAAALHLLPYFGAEPVRAAPTELSKEERQRKVADEFFKGPIVKLAIEFTPEELERLKRDNRNYAEATIKEEGGKVYKGAAIKLKGAAGSFQGVDGKPGMTISMAKFKGADRFHGMKKFHLNNGQQDPTYLNELIAGEMARAAGVPASRCTHVFVTLNGRDLGLYVFKEAFTRDFLSYFYPDPEGDLYDGGFCREIDENSEKDLGDPKDKRDLQELMAACREGDAAKRWERLGKILDIEQYLAFTAMESVMCHWDGYNFNRNNYRFYKDPASGKFAFFMHGMDQMFNDANFPLVRDLGTLVGGAVWRCPQAPPLYRAKVENIYTNVLQPIDWPARAVAAGTRVREALAARNADQGKNYLGQINNTRDRVAARITNVGKLLAAMPKPIEFDKSGVMKLAGAWQQTPTGGAQIAESKVDGKPSYHIVAQSQSAASWRKTLALPPGKYRFEAMAKSNAITTADDPKGKGAGLRVSGANFPKRTVFLEGTSEWKPVTYEFDAPGGDTILVAELRAAKGEVWFLAESMQLVKLK